ncbi:MAG: ABC transporter permease [Firmicutes bacterium]|nr:ABC transporter permease [Bacillota bacterium]
MSEIIKNSFRNLTRKKARTLLSIIAIAVGVTSVIVIWGISNAGTEMICDEFKSLGLDGISVGKSVNNISSAIGESEFEVIAANANVEKATPVIYSYSAISKVGDTNNPTNCVMWGVPEDAGDAVSLEIVHGRMINSEDMKDKSNVCLIDEATSSNIFGKENSVGENIQIMSNGKPVECKIIGIVRTGSGILQNMLGNFIPTFVYTPLTFAEKIEKRSDYDRITVKLKDSDTQELEAICSDINDQLIGALDENSKSKTSYSVTNLAHHRDSLMSIMNIITLVLTAIGGISLMVAGMGIMTIMTVSVNERTHEIGIRKAIGASRLRIMLDFIVEAIMLTMIGCVAGIAASCVIGWISELAFGFKMAINLNSIFLISVFSIFVGILFGAYPAFKASCMKPVDALREGGN